MRPDAAFRAVIPFVPAAPVARAALCAVLVVGCGGDAPTEPPEPQPTGSTAETGSDDTGTLLTEDPQVEKSREGSVVLYRDAAIKDGNEGAYKFYALFGDDLNGVGTGQQCVDRGVCIHELPERVGDYVELDRVIRTTEIDYDWVGEQVGIGNSPRDWFEVPFLIARGGSADESAEIPEFGFYSGNAERLDNDEIPPLGVRISEGQWGDGVEVERDDGIPLDRLPKLVLPQANDGVVNAQAVMQFNWEWPEDPEPPEPAIDRGTTPLYLRVKGNEAHRIYRLPDEGPFELELGGLGFNETSQVEFYFGRWHNTEAFFPESRNDLHVYGAIERKLVAETCDTGAFTSVNLAGPGGGAEKPAVAVPRLGVAFDGLVLSGDIYDYGWDAKGTGAETPTSSSLTFTAFDNRGDAICSVQYDASRAEPVPVNQVRAANAARLFEAYEITISNATTDCTRLDSAVFEGFNTLPQALESTNWIIAFGEMDASAGPLEDAYGDDWETVKDQMYGLYVQRVIDENTTRCPDAPNTYVDVELFAVEAGAGFAYQQSSCGVLNPDMVPLRYRPGVPMKSAIYSTTPVLPFNVMLPECDTPETE